MLDNIRPYKMIFIQKASPNVGDAFDFAYIYKFFQFVFFILVVFK